MAMEIEGLDLRHVTTIADGVIRFYVYFIEA